MIDFHEDYYCEKCGHRESSSVGNPLYSFGVGRKQVLVCKDCLKELEEEEKEREKDFLIQEEE